MLKLTQMETEAIPETMAPCGPKYSISGNSIEEVSLKVALLLAEHAWPGFRVINYKKSQTYETVLPGGPRFAFEHGLVPQEVKLKFKLYWTKEPTRRKGDEWSVFDYCNMSYGMRLARGFSLWNGSTSPHLNDYDPSAKQSLAAWHGHLSGTRRTFR